MNEMIFQAWRYPPVRWAILISVATAAMLLLLPGLWLGGYGSEGFMPHMHCWLRNPAVTWLHVLSDATIGLAYLTISFTLGYIVYRARRDIPFHWMFIAFGLFIVTCGFTHLIAMVNVWQAFYWLEGDVKAITAVASTATAVVLPATVPRIFALIHDAKVSDQRKRDLEAAHERLKEHEELKSQFFANVSHELRTPLSLILGPVRRQLTATNLTSDQRDDLQVVERNVNLLLQQINNLLDLAKFEAGSMSPAYARTDLAELVRLGSSYFDSLAAERQITFELHCPDSLPAEIDPDKIQRVFLNLLSNAFKFTPEGGTIRCSLQTRDGEGLFIIEDSGPGVPTELHAAVFERFRQVDGGVTRTIGGTGLGLPIAREFTELHGGQIELSAASLGGARFEVRLPLQAPAGADVAPSAEQFDLSRGRQATAELESYQRPTASTEDIPPDEDASRPLVLVVEDNPDMNAFIANTLRPRYRVARAFDGQDGLDKARRLQPELIVSDIMMPQMSGDQMIRHLQDDEQLAEIPVVVLTAKADDEQRVQLLEQSVQDHLLKPFQAEELLARVGGIIGRRRKTIRKLRALNASLEQRVTERTEQVRRQANQLRRLAAELNTTEQRERRQLAQALHDHLQQLLVSASMSLERAKKLVEPDAAELLQQVGETLDQSLQASRTLTVELYPPVLYDRGLGAALHWLAGHVKQQHGLDVQVELDDSAEPTDQDLQAFLFSAVQELLLNVIKHAKTDRAIVNMQRQETSVLITVEDHGVGCTPEKVREPSDNGGFGLFNIRERLHIIGGAMDVEAAPDSGCRVELYCPLKIDGFVASPPLHSTGDSDAQSHPDTTAQPAAQPTIRVMIVDDHKIMREGLNGLLADESDIEVVAEAADGREAIAMLERAVPDVVIMDVSMPRMDGVEATTRIKRDYPEIRVIGLSMHSTSDLADAMVQAGAARYLTKGGPSSDLVDAIRRAGAAD